MVTSDQQLGNFEEHLLAELKNVVATRVAEDAVPVTGRPARRPWRRLVLAAAAVGTAAAVAAAAFFIASPTAAYAVDKHADGSIGVSFNAKRLQDTSELNAELARAGARTVVIRMVPADQCTAPLDMDPMFPYLPPTATQAELDRWPVSFQIQDAGLVITIRPGKMPAGDTLVFGYAIRNIPGGRDMFGKPAVVRTLPPCMAIPARARR
jgi:hypothetical protein